MARLLVVEDDAAISRPLVLALERRGFAVEHLDRGEPARARVFAGGIDLVLLDLSLPDVDGLEVCRQLRNAHPDLPVIMLTARAEEVDVVVGLDAGADDYVTKPFRVAELLARIGARLRSRSTAGQDSFTVGDERLRVDTGAHRAWHDDEELDLTPTEFNLLALLVTEARHTVTRQRIMRAVWDEDWWGPTRTLDMHVSSLRRKLGDRDGRVIVTVRGVGFRFDPIGE
ncbi:MAG: response regulator transcription factor [Mycetocola sp.]